MRTGIHSGPAVSGVLGSRKYQYDVFGDTVNIAARMEQTCETGCVQISRNTYTYLLEESDIRLELFEEKKVFVKGKGETETYLYDLSSELFLEKAEKQDGIGMDEVEKEEPPTENSLHDKGRRRGSRVHDSLKLQIPKSCVDSSDQRIERKHEVETESPESTNLTDNEIIDSKKVKWSGCVRVSQENDPRSTTKWKQKMERTHSLPMIVFEKKMEQKEKSEEDLSRMMKESDATPQRKSKSLFVRNMRNICLNSSPSGTIVESPFSTIQAPKFQSRIQAREVGKQEEDDVEVRIWRHGSKQKSDIIFHPIRRPSTGEASKKHAKKRY